MPASNLICGVGDTITELAVVSIKHSPGKGVAVGILASPGKPLVFRGRVTPWDFQIPS